MTILQIPFNLDIILFKLMERSEIHQSSIINHQSIPGLSGLGAGG